MWIPDGVHGGFLGGIRGRVAIVVGEKIPQVRFLRVEIQLEVDHGRVVSRRTGMIVV